MSWHPVEYSELEIADYRPAAVITGNIHEIAKTVGARIHSFEEEGMGPAHAFFLKKGNPATFCILQHYEYAGDGKIINIELKNQAKLPRTSLSRQDLHEVLAYIKAGPDATDWVSEWVE